MKKLIITKEQYNGLVKAGLIKESMAPIVKGGPNRIQKSFNKEFAGVNEDGELNIKAPLKGSGITSAQNKPIKAHKSIQRISENEKGGNDKITKEIKDLLKHLYGYTPEFNSDYWVGEKNKSSEEICEHLSNKGLIVKKGRNYIVPKSLGSSEEAKAAIEECMREFVGEPKEEIDEDYPLGAEHDPNAPWNQEDPEEIENHTDYDIFVYNDGMAILNEGKEFFLLDFYDNDVDYEGREMTEHDINKFLNENERELPKILIPLDINLVDELGEMYNLNAHFMKKLEQIKNILGGMDKGLEEMSSTGGVGGSFTGLFSGKPMEEDGIIKREINEMNMTTVGKIAYDNPGLVGISRDGKFPKNPKKTKAEENTQWSGGSFVEFDDCTKLNNNKTAQNGGCSTGAVNGVVKLKKTSGNINAPSLSENKIFEEIAKRTGKTIQEVKQIISNKK